MFVSMALSMGHSLSLFNVGFVNKAGTFRNIVDYSHAEEESVHVAITCSMALYQRSEFRETRWSGCNRYSVTNIRSLATFSP